MKSKSLLTIFFLLSMSINGIELYAQSTSNGVSASVRFGTMNSGRRRSCSPSASICSSSSLGSVRLKNGATPTAATTFFVDVNNRLNLLIHTDSLLTDGDLNGPWMYNFLHSAYNTPHSGQPIPGYSGPAFLWQATSSLDNSICNKLGLQCTNYGFTIPQNTYCAMSRPTSDTNYFQIAFLDVAPGWNESPQPVTNRFYPVTPAENINLVWGGYWGCPYCNSGSAMMNGGVACFTSALSGFPVYAQFFVDSSLYSSGAPPENNYVLWVTFDTLSLNQYNTANGLVNLAALNFATVTGPYTSNTPQPGEFAPQTFILNPITTMINTSTTDTLGLYLMSNYTFNITNPDGTPNLQVSLIYGCYNAAPKYYYPLVPGCSNCTTCNSCNYGDNLNNRMIKKSKILKRSK